ncbi:hypothetical protein [Streptomyces huiliensis]|uniref:hypothetical protein n=1 Tax=Streptomyces huiliensis TaxID=2876027 RepID=UPI001CBFBD57|nr:hypothetical protein [Streptomyces huiliensis]MBZ4321046.1 hypothetical protein [Streptomyces huiliensis]
MDRLDQAGRWAAYGAAAVLAPYALIKVSWVVGALAGLLPADDGLGLTGWVVLNTATIGMAGIGIAMALALVRPWGMRVPGPLVAFVAWVGTGFLVAVLPYAVLDSLLGVSSGDGSGQRGDDGSSMPGWEAALIQTGFVGTGLGLAVALPAYLRRRWPDVFAGRIGDGGDGGDGGHGGDGRHGPALWAAGVAAVIGAVWLYWAFGGTAGVARVGDRNTAWRLLTGVCGLWALTASAATWTVGRGRPARLPRWIPLALGWLGTGSLFAWSGWKLPFTLYLLTARPDDVSSAENLALAAVLHAAAVIAGAAMLPALVRVRGRTKPLGAADASR